ncbi:hypothetical protein HYPSUDRAFT_65922 [Hypholoma sublateritium FD-334 SS-4]|uniref:Uncharacterized protein n=1 Tax=Hypholoma sublateritium (strain FD-334 SS-4) TaxID=945553 RepID=A0A0D2NZQ0_HYPSF|nr:hypothetical protein HYPSUDRAFT_65922 [Hypholoma sublateritium FD-334 SS-4]
MRAFTLSALSSHPPRASPPPPSRVFAAATAPYCLPARAASEFSWPLSPHRMSSLVLYRLPNGLTRRRSTTKDPRVHQPPRPA